MAHFLESARSVLSENGKVCVSLVRGQAERWELNKQAQKVGLKSLPVQTFHEGF